MRVLVIVINCLLTLQICYLSTAGCNKVWGCCWEAGLPISSAVPPCSCTEASSTKLAAFFLQPSAPPDRPHVPRVTRRTIGCPATLAPALTPIFAHTHLCSHRPSLTSHTAELRGRSGEGVKAASTPVDPVLLMRLKSCKLQTGVEDCSMKYLQNE